MAQPIPFAPPTRTQNGAEQRLEQAPAQHADAILSALELLQLLQDRGVLDLARGLVGAGDRIAEILTSAIDTPEAIRGIRNFLLLTKFFASIPPEVLNSLAQTAVEGANREKSRRAPSLLQLLRRMRSENTRHAIAVTLDLVESVGKAL